MEINHPLQWDPTYFWTCYYRGLKIQVYADTIKDARTLAAKAFARKLGHSLVRPEHITAIRK